MDSHAYATNPSPRSVLLVGAGGIGSQLLQHVAAGLRTAKTDLTVMDGDLVESGNLAHQQFTLADVGRPKAEVLAERLTSPSLRITAVAEDLREAEQLQGYDLIVVAVDRPAPRRLVHASAVPWIDLRSTGRGAMSLTHLDDVRRVREHTLDHPPASCQAAGLLEAGFVQFGFALAAAIGAQWLVDHIVHGRSPSRAMMMDAAYGGLHFSPLEEVKA